MGGDGRGVDGRSVERSSSEGKGSESRKEGGRGSGRRDSKTKEVTKRGSTGTIDNSFTDIPKQGSKGSDNFLTNNPDSNLILKITLPGLTLPVCNVTMTPDP